MDFLSVFALLLLFSIGIAFAYGLIILHDIPYKIAKKRNHPHAEAIEAAGWVSLFLMHAIWPFLWIWAMLYHPERGFSTSRPAVAKSEEGKGRLTAANGTGVEGEGSMQAAGDVQLLRQNLRDLEQRLAALETSPSRQTGEGNQDSRAAG